MTDEEEHDPGQDECNSRRTVQLGRMSATDLKCVLKRWEHIEPVHFTARRFEDVVMTAKWPGDFEEAFVVCPRCGMKSFNPNDIREGYCGNCHDWTSRGTRG